MRRLPTTLTTALIPEIHSAMDKPSVEYPCHWPYTVIVEDPEALQQALVELLAQMEYRSRLSHRSRTGRYCSVHLTVQVSDEAQRDRVFRQLSDLATVKHVM